MGRPIELAVRIGWYIVREKYLKARKRFPLVTMLEPLEACNLACEGCGRIREYESVIHRTLTADECLAAVEESGAPIVSIAGGEPTIHPHLPEIVRRITEQKKFVYCCTNGLMMSKMMKEIPPSKYFCWVVHLDGTGAAHDAAVSRKGVYQIAIKNAEKAIQAGYRVCSNTTLFRGSNPEDLHALFRMCSDMGFEGCMVSPAYDYQAVPNQQLFLTRQQAISVFKQVLSPDNQTGIKFYNNPLFLQFLRGERSYKTCTAWSNPTYTIMGWRKPCYPLAEGHTQQLSDLMGDELWERYGNGQKNPRCANCMMHCGYESATIFGALSSPKDALDLVRSGAITKSGITAA
ncbi:MAG: adenosyl-hopene transferase HpnH [Chloroflexi bacterium]|nr:adenosyl-hopene transferase HpnH [Chloroflexota bacterium]